jgi:hypothetical protein
MNASEQSGANCASDPVDTQTLPRRRRAWRLGSVAPWPELVLLAFFSLYLVRRVNTQLVFWNQNDLFLWNRRFVSGFCVSAGQPCEWLGKLLLQTCHYDWCGAVAIAAVACMALLAMRAISLRIAPIGAVRVAWAASALMLVVLHSQYDYDLACTVSLSLALMATWIYLSASNRNRWIRWVAFVVAAVVLYYLAGAALWTFVACCVIAEGMAARQRGFALCLLVSAGGIVVGINIGLSFLNQSFWHLDLPEKSYLITSAWDAWLPLVVFAWYPACVFAMVAFSRRAQSLENRSSESEKNAIESPAPRKPVPTFFSDDASDWGDSEDPEDRSDSPRRTTRFLQSAAPVAKWSVLAVGAAGMLWMSPSRVVQKILEVDLAANDHRWQTVLDAARGVPRALNADYANHDVNQALYHLGRLPEEMFQYPQQRLICDHGFGARGRMFSRKAFDVLLELGRVNEAEIIAHNDFEKHPSAIFLLRIAETKIIKGQYDAARMYLRALRDDACYGNRADIYLHRADKNRSLLDLDLAQIRARMITADDAVQTQQKQPDGSWAISTEGTLLSLLKQDPRNRMAFEYMMAHHLLNRDPAAAVKEFPRLKTFAYPRTPLSYEQAALLHAGNQRQKPQMTSFGVMINGCLIRQETVSQFMKLYEIDNKFDGFAKPAAQVAIQRLAGNSYFAYFFKAGSQVHE